MHPTCCSFLKSEMRKQDIGGMGNRCHFWQCKVRANRFGDGYLRRGVCEKAPGRHKLWVSFHDWDQDSLSCIVCLFASSSEQ